MVHIHGKASLYGHIHGKASLYGAYSWKGFTIWCIFMERLHCMVHIHGKASLYGAYSWKGFTVWAYSWKGFTVWCIFMEMLHCMPLYVCNGFTVCVHLYEMSFPLQICITGCGVLGMYIADKKSA